MSEPTTPPVSQAIQSPRSLAHARMPRFATWLQDNLLLPLLILASGYVNGIMLTEGWVPNIEDPRTWGLFHGIGVVVLFAAGLAMGGLTLRISYKLSECVLRKQGGRAVFLACGLVPLVLIEFWASFSQRAPNLHPTAADALLPIPTLPFSVTAILIAAVIPFASQLWGFAADDPAPAPVEDPATLKARLENERTKAHHAAALAVIRAKGVRAGAGALFASEKADALPAPAASYGDSPTGEYPASHTAAPPRRAVARAKPTPDSLRYAEWVHKQALAMQENGKHLTIDAIAAALEEAPDDIQRALEAIRERQVAKLRPGMRITDPVLSAI